VPEKSKEEMALRLKQKWLRNFGRDRLLPSEEFVQEASGRWIIKAGKGVEPSESDGLNPSTSMGSDSPPEKKKKEIFQICDYCKTRFKGGSYSLIQHQQSCQAYISFRDEQLEKEQRQKQEHKLEPDNGLSSLVRSIVGEDYENQDNIEEFVNDGEEE